MREIVDATWRALAYCLHPRTLLWSLLPLGVVGAVVFALGWYWWEPSVAGVRAWLDDSDLTSALFEWLDSLGLPDFRPVLAPMILVALGVPAVVMFTLLLVAWLMAPAMVNLVVRRRFPALQCSPGAAGRWRALGWSVVCSLFALLALCLSGCQASKPAAEQPAKSAPATISTESDDRPVIVAFGDSLTAGYNLSEAENYTTLLQQKLDAQGYRYRVVNAGADRQRQTVDPGTRRQ
jgi:hypothetical protein